MTSQGTELGQLTKALNNAIARGNLDLALACARDLGTVGSVSLGGAARILHLMAKEKSPLFDRAAAHWLTRYMAEVKGVTAEQIADVAIEVADLPDMNAAEVLLAAVRGPG